MKTKNQELNSFQTTLNSGSTFEIATETQGQIIDFLSSNIYKDPIGTIIREYASNAWDANVEAGVLEPIIITINEDASGVYCSITDFGVGISESRVSDIFTKYGKSTKNESNNEIGGFGIGGKCAFAYTDSFLVNTIFNGVLYNYVVTKTQDSPKMFLLSKLEIPDAKSGTEIKIYLKNRSDSSYFLSKAKQQLVNFENVIIRYFDNDDLLINKESIFETETFVVNPNYKEMLGISSYANVGFYALVGPVSYPISGLSHETQRFISYPIGVKFDIGEIDVTLSREELRMTEKTIECVNVKVEAVKKRLFEMYKSQKKYSFDFIEHYQKMIKRESLIFDNGFSVDLNLNNSDKNQYFLAGYPKDINIPIDCFFLKVSLKYNISDCKFSNLRKTGDSVSYKELFLEDNFIIYDDEKKVNAKRKIVFLNAKMKDSNYKNIIVVQRRELDYRDYKNKIRKNHIITEDVNFTKRILLFKSSFENKIIDKFQTISSIEIPKNFFGKNVSQRVSGLSLYSIKEPFGVSYRKMTLLSDGRLSHNLTKRKYQIDCKIIYIKEEKEKELVDLFINSKIQSVLEGFKGETVLFLKPTCEDSLTFLEDNLNAYHIDEVLELTMKFEKRARRHHELKKIRKFLSDDLFRFFIKHDANKLFTKFNNEKSKLVEKYKKTFEGWYCEKEEDYIISKFFLARFGEEYFQDSLDFQTVKNLMERYKNIYKELTFIKNEPSFGTQSERENFQFMMKEYFRTRNFRINRVM